MATGVLDILYVLVFHYRQLDAIAGDGYFNAVDPGAAFSTFDRERAFWHLMFGAMALILGGMVHWSQNRTGTLLSFLGWARPGRRDPDAGLRFLGGLAAGDYIDPGGVTRTPRSRRRG